MKNLHLLLSFAFLSFLFYGCKKDEAQPAPVLANGDFEVNPSTIPNWYVTVYKNSTTNPTSYSSAYTTEAASTPIHSMKITSDAIKNDSSFAILETEYAIAKQAVRVLVQQQDLRQDVSPTGGNSCSYSLKRDKYMAENIQWMLGQTGVGKASLWAHNGHIGSLAQYYCYPTMGHYLKQQLKERYLPIGTLFTNGTFNVYRSKRQLGPQTVQTAAGSYNYLFGKAKLANFALIMNQAGLDPMLLNWLNGPEPLFEIGAAYDETKDDRAYTGLATLRARFDMLIHFRDTNPSQFIY